MSELLILLQSSSGSSGVSSFIPIILIFVVIYFFMIRPQINKQKEEDLFQSKLKKGDTIVTIGGIHGKISFIKDYKIVININENTKITIDRNAISREKSIVKNTTNNQ